MPLPPTFPARLLSARMLTPQVRELTFEREDGQPLEFDAGQWVSLALPGDDADLKRSYSIASAPDGTSRFSIAVTLVQGGPGSERLHALEVGRSLGVTGPQGFFTRDKGRGSPALFVGTGTGMTPLFSMATDATRRGETSRIHLLIGVRHAADRLYADELAALSAGHPHLVAEYTLSQPPPEWSGKHGYVQTHVRALYHELAAGGQPPHVYICGLERMVKSVRELLRKDMGLPRELVHSERYD